MNFGHSLWILSILLMIHFHSVLLMELEETSKRGDDDIGTSDNPKKAEMVDKFPTHLLPPSLAWMFALLEWVTKSWPQLAKQPDIIEGMPTAIGALKQKGLDEIVKFVGHIGNNYFVHGEYPNTKAMGFVNILENVLNEVHNTEFEITTGLRAEATAATGEPGPLHPDGHWERLAALADEDENARRLRHKNEFRFAFMVDCIYAAHMDARGNINFGDIGNKVAKPGVHGFIRYPSVTAHPLHDILTENKCGEQEVRHTFLTILLDRFYVFNPRNAKSAIEEFFYNDVLQQFLTSMRIILTEEEWEAEKRERNEKERARKEGKPAPAPASKPIPPVYWPERLPKLHNLACLLQTLSDIIRAIINGMEKRYSLLNDRFHWLKSEVQNVPTSASHGLTDIRALMYFAIQNGTHYAEAVTKLSSEHGIQEKMGGKITHEQSFFTYLVGMKQYDYLSKTIYYVHLPKYLAINTFGFNEKQQLPANPPEPERYVNDEVFFNHRVHQQQYQYILINKIGQKIVNEYRESFENSSEHVQELDMQLVHQIQWNVVCVGLQNGMANAHKYTNFGQFYKNFDDLLSKGLSSTDREKAVQILKEIWKNVVYQGFKQIYAQICGPRKVEVPVQG